MRCRMAVLHVRNRVAPPELLLFLLVLVELFELGNRFGVLCLAARPELVRADFKFLFQLDKVVVNHRIGVRHRRPHEHPDKLQERTGGGRLGSWQRSSLPDCVNQL